MTEILHNYWAKIFSFFRKDQSDIYKFEYYVEETMNQCTEDIITKINDLRSEIAFLSKKQNDILKMLEARQYQDIHEYNDGAMI